MVMLPIIKIDNDENGILRKVAEPVAPSEIAELQPLIEDMLATVLEIGAVGLSAPQVGVSKQLFVLRDGTVCINPSVTIGKGKITSHREGCLSLPGRFRITRARNLIVRCLDRNGNPIVLKPHKLHANSKLYSVAMQHEIDHLNGRLVCDKGKEV